MNQSEKQQDVNSEPLVLQSLRGAKHNREMEMSVKYTVPGITGITCITLINILTAVAKKKIWFASIILVFTLSLIGAGISGCQGPWVEATVFVDNGGELYIAIPEAKKHKHAVLHALAIDKIDGTRDASSIYWAFYKSGYSSDADVTAFPVRYGESIKGSITEFPAKKLGNGTYIIRGFVKFFDSDELGKVGTPFHPAHVKGCFEYENGVVRNLPY